MSTAHLPSPKDIQRFVCPVAEMAGNHDLKNFLLSERQRPIDEARSFVIVGDPGTGKTTAAIDQIRAITDNRLDGMCSDFDPNIGLHFTRINGASVTGKRLRRFLRDGLDDLILIDEIGELYYRGDISYVLSAIREWPEKKIFATAQSFSDPKRRERVKSSNEHKTALLDQLIWLETELPTDAEMHDWIKKRQRQWGIAIEDSKALNLLVGRAHGRMGWVTNCLSLAAAQPNRTLTNSIVRQLQTDLQ